MDLWVFNLINRTAGQYPALDFLMVGIAMGPQLAAPVLVGLLWFWPGAKRHQRRKRVIFTVMAVLLALGINTLPAVIYYRPRPFVVHDVILLISLQPSPSFPASHAAGAAAAACLLSGRSHLLGRLLWLVVVLANMIARIYVGVHYPADVLVGALIGWLTGEMVRNNQGILSAFADRTVAMVEELFRW